MEKGMPRGAGGPPMAVEVRGRGGGSPQARGSGLVADREFTDASGSGIGVPLAQNREGVCPSGPICGGVRALGGDEAEPAELRWKEGDVAGDLPGGGVGAGFAKETLQGAPRTVHTKRVSRPPVMRGQATRKRENRENAKTAETKCLDLTQLTVF